MSSSGEDGDAEWRAAINSIAASFTGGRRCTKAFPLVKHEHDDDAAKACHFRPLKHYQIKAQILLDELLEQNLEIVKNDAVTASRNPERSESDIKLFSNAPPGIIFDFIDEPLYPRKRPRILKTQEIDEKSKKFKRHIQSVVVDGFDVMVQAHYECHRLLSRFEAKSAAAKAKAKMEEVRIEKLKRERGEKWLPSVAEKLQAGCRVNRRDDVMGVVL